MVLDTILTFDLGTTGCKVCLWDAGGSLLASADQGYPIHHPKPDWAEQDPEDWWNAAVTAGRQCLAGQEAHRIAAIGLSSQREGVVPIGQDGRPLARCIIWMDRRCREQSARLGKEFGESFLHHHTGVAPDPNYTACKLLWLREHQPDLLAQTTVFLQPRDFLYYRLTGQPAMDYTLACRTMMLDLRRERWWPEMFARVGIRADQFPPLYRSIEAPHRVAAEAAAALGIPAGIPVALGGGDRSCEAVGAGLSGNRASDSTGTATQVSMVADRLPEDLGRVPCGIHAVPARYLFELGASTTASAMRWLRELFGLPPEEAAALEREVAQSPPGARNLLMFPFLMGARSTRWNPDARGLLLGLSLGHTRGDIARALMEGVGYEVSTCLDGLRDIGVTPGELVVIGGGAKSDLWAQIKADILGMAVYRPRYTEAASLGAAILAATAVGLVTDPVATARAWNPPVQTFVSNAEATRIYQDRRTLFDDVYAALLPLYPRLQAS
jgi:xylulokinase